MFDWFSSEGDEAEINLEEEYAIPVRDVYESNHPISNGYLPVAKDLSVLILGETGAGKTSTMELFREQLDVFPQDPVIVLDYQGNLDERGFYDPEWDIVLSVEDSTHYWNVFDDIEGGMDYDVVAQSLTADVDGKAFFQDGAERVMKSLLIHIDKALENPETRDLVEYTRPARGEKDSHMRIAEELLNSPDPRVRDGAVSLHPDSGETGINMFQTVVQNISDFFVGDFNPPRGAPDFSVRDYMHNPEGRVLAINMRSKPETAQQAYRTIVDLAMLEAQQVTSNYTYFLLDEFNRLGELQQLVDFVESIRERKGQAIFGVQSISNIEKVYREKAATQILINAPQQFIMRSTGSNVEYAREDLLGKSQQSVPQSNPRFQRGMRAAGALKALKSGPLGIATAAYMLFSTDPVETPREYHRMSEDEFRGFDNGEAIVVSPDGDAHVQLNEWKDLPEEDQQFLGGQEVRLGDADAEFRDLVSVAADPDPGQANLLFDALFYDDIEFRRTGLSGLNTLLCERGHNPETVIAAADQTPEEIVEHTTTLVTAGHDVDMRAGANMLLTRVAAAFADLVVPYFDELLDNLESEHPEMRSTTVFAIGVIVATTSDSDRQSLILQARDAIIPLADDPHVEVREAVAAELPTYPQNDETQEALRELSNDEPPVQRALRMTNERLD